MPHPADDLRRGKASRGGELLLFCWLQEGRRGGKGESAGRRELEMRVVLNHPPLPLPTWVATIALKGGFRFRGVMRS